MYIHIIQYHLLFINYLKNGSLKEITIYILILNIINNKLKRSFKLLLLVIL